MLPDSGAQDIADRLGEFQESACLVGSDDAVDCHLLLLPMTIADGGGAP